MNQHTQQVLDSLREHNGFVSGESLCQRLRVSRTAIWKYVRSLRALGYAICSCPHRGYRIESAPNAPIESELLPRLKTQRFGRPFVFERELDSTNRLAADLARQGAAEGATVVADAQTRGRGRLAREWFSPAGVNVYASVVLRPAVPPAQTPQVALVTAIAVVRAIRALQPRLQLGIKWPNDVYAGGRKLCGILCEMDSELDRVRHLILGIGINVNLPPDAFPPSLAASATSVLCEVGQETSRPELLARLLAEMETAYDRWCKLGLGPFIKEWERLSILAGKQVVVRTLSGEVEGEACGLAADGALVLRQADRTTRLVMAGDVCLASATAQSGIT